MLAAWLLAVWAGAAAAQTSRLDEVRARGELRVCIWPDYFAISYRNPRNGALEGIDIDMAQAFAQRLGVRLQFVDTSFAAFMDRIEEGACDVAMFGVGVTEPRAARIAFSQPYLISRVYGVTTRDNRQLRGWADIDQPGVVVAVAAGTIMEPLMRDTLRRAELLVLRPPATREAEVQGGRADVFMSDFPYTRRMLLMHDWARVLEPPGPFGETRYAYSVARGDAAWLAEVNAFLDAARANGTLLRAAERNGLGPIVVREIE
jgi:ABC-type amino acid transport substrate-binding protein